VGLNSLGIFMGAKKSDSVDYLYDGTFQGFLCCVFFHYRKAPATGVYRQEAYQRNIFTNYEIVDTDDNQAEVVYNAIQKKISDHDLKRIYSAFSSDDPEKETKILRYIILGFKQGSAIRLLHSDVDVFNLQQLERKVYLEVHRMCGLVRFTEMKPSQGQGIEYQERERHGRENQKKEYQETKGKVRKSILYAPIEPDNDIVEFLAPHFVDRLKEEVFIIHDKKRNKAVVYANNDWYITDFADDGFLSKTKEEEGYRRLWRLYFDTIAIRERTNPACQKRFMPVRYWSNLVEFTKKI
jgi:probable DNA metabolism protein